VESAGRARRGAPSLAAQIESAERAVVALWLLRLGAEAAEVTP
jgi:hypothetical protein